MFNSNALYLLTAIFMAVSFIGLQVFDGLWIFLVTMAIGVLLFLIRIFRGDD